MHMKNSHEVELQKYLLGQGNVYTVMFRSRHTLKNNDNKYFENLMPSKSDKLY